MRFYRMTYAEVMSLPVDVERDLWEAIDVLEAQETLLKYNIALYPNLKVSAKKREFEAMQKKAYPRKLYPGRSISKEELAKKFNGG